MINYDIKPIILGALTAAGIIMILISLSVYYDSEVNNKINYTENVVISGKICNDNVFGETVSKIQLNDGRIMFIDNNKCKNIVTGESTNIVYNKIRNGANDNFVFLRVVEIGGRL